MHSAKLFLLFIRQLWLFSPQFSFRPGNGHPFASTQTYQIAFKLGKRRQHVKKHLTHRGLGKLLYQIHSNYNDEWDIEKFMHYCQVSKSQLFRLFQATFNQSPLKWLKNYRLFQARRLLVETQESISRIAVQVGYNDPLHFSRDFHRAVGLSPSAFRKQEQLEGAHASRHDVE